MRKSFMNLMEDLKQLRREIRKAQDEWTIASNKLGDRHPDTKKASRKLSVLLGKQEDHYMKKHQEKKEKKSMGESVGTVPGGIQMDESDSYKVGDRVHMGLAVKGGAGHIGTVHKIDGDSVHIKLHEYGKFGERVVKGHKSLVSSLHEDKQSEYDEETELINQNKKKPENQKEHMFKSAKFTHPNGHPRCIHCGDEESMSGKCSPSLEESLQDGIISKKDEKVLYPTITNPYYKGRHQADTMKLIKAQAKERDDNREFESLTENHEKEAKLLGLTHYGNGQYGREGMVTHRAPKDSDKWGGLVRLTKPYKTGGHETLIREEYKVGDHVIAKIGPHKGELHRIIHVHENGQVNITPVHSIGKRNRYGAGAATTDVKHLEPAHIKEETIVAEPSKRRTQVHNKQIVQEVFKKALEKKKPKDKKTKQIDVKGPGAEEKFQKNPTVSPLTTTYTRA